MNICFSKVQKGNTIIVKWAMTIILAVFVPMILGSQYLSGVFESKLFYISGLLFSFCLFKNMKQILELANEQDILVGYCDKLRNNFIKGFSSLPNSMFKIHIMKLMDMAARGKSTVKQDNLVEILNTRLQNQNGLLSTISNLLITMGLIGTIVGLITTVDGLGIIISSNEMLEGMKETMSGMGTAFYTTLIGSILGGIIVKVMYNYTNSVITDYVLEVSEITEVIVVPEINKEITNRIKDTK